jgi:hypothetical protein
MNGDDRTYSTSEIREKRREVERWVTLQQRQLAALAKIDEGTLELEQVEREMAALTRGEAEPEQPADVASDEPQMTGERALMILKDDHPDEWRDGRGTLGDFAGHGWIGDRDPEIFLQSLRHSLRRLADNNPHVERKTEKGGKHYYRYNTHLDRDALIPVAAVNGVAHPALRGGSR